MPPEVRDAIASPIPTRDIGLTVFAAPFVGIAPKASVALVIEVDPGALTFVQKDGTFNADLEIHLLAIDGGGKAQGGGRSVVPLRLREASYGAVTKNGLRITRRLELPPGRYQIHVGARETSSGKLGTIRQDLDVPDFSKAPLSDERAHAHVGIRRAHHDGEPRPRFQGRAARVPDGDSRVSAPATRSRSSPRSTTTRPARRTASRSPRPWPATTAACCSPPKTSATARIWRGRRAATATWRRSRSRSWRAGRYVLRVEARTLLDQRRHRLARAGVPRPMTSSLTTIARGDGSGIVEAQRTIVRDAGQWRALWAAHAGPAATAPEVDFTARMVAAAFAGERPTPGFEIEITGPARDGQALTLAVTERSPAPGMMAAQMIVTPFHIVTLAPVRRRGAVRIPNPESPAFARARGSALRRGSPAFARAGRRALRRGRAGCRGSRSRGRRLARPSPRASADSARPRGQRRRCGRAPSSTGLEPNVAAALAYLAGPFSGVLILLVERANSLRPLSRVAGDRRPRRAGGAGGGRAGPVVSHAAALAVRVHGAVPAVGGDCGRVGRRVGDLPREGVHRACLEDACAGPVRGTARGAAAIRRPVPSELRYRRVEGPAHPAGPRSRPQAALTVPGLARGLSGRAYSNFLTALTSMLPFACEKAHWG